MAYVACGNRLVVIDVSESPRPRIVSNLTFGPYAWAPYRAVAVAGTSAYVVGGSESLIYNDDVLGGGELQVVDVADPDRPRLVKTFESRSGLADVAAAGSGAVAADMPRGLVRLAAPDAANLERYGTAGIAADVAVADGHAYVPGLWQTTVVDTVNRQAPRAVASIDNQQRGEMRRVGAGGGVLAIGESGFAGPNNRTRFFDVRQPAAPRETLVLDESMSDGVVHAGVGYLAMADGLRLFDLHDPGAPRDLGRALSLGPWSDLAIDSAYLGAAGGEALSVIDVSDPLRPREVARRPAGDRFQTIEIGGGHVFAGSRATIIVASVTDSALTTRAQLALPGAAVGIALAGDTLYVSARQFGLGAFDVSDLAAPRRLEAPFVAEAGRLATDGKTAYLAAGADGLLVLARATAPPTTPAPATATDRATATSAPTASPTAPPTSSPGGPPWKLLLPNLRRDA